MATIGRLAVQITADTGGLKTGLNEATGQTDKASKAMIGHAKAIGAAFATYLTVDLFTGVIKGAAEAGRQIDQLSKLSATSAANFQAQAYAAQQFGISNEKLGDIFKDVQDKIGDFMQTGAGPMVDFFEKIAPQVGVTADQFRTLGGPDALQLYVSSLEKANLTQSEMTFYLEAIASDSALLLPLLKNNGAEMGRLAEEARNLGAVLSDETIKANKDFAAQIDRLNSLTNSLSVSIGSALIPELNELINQFLVGMKVAGGFWSALGLIGTSKPFDNPALGAKHYREELDRLGKERDKLMEREGIMANTSGYDREIEQSRKLLEYHTKLMQTGWNLSGERMGMNDPRVIGTARPEETAGFRPPPATGGKPGAAAKPIGSIFDDGDPVQQAIAANAEKWREQQARLADESEAKYAEGLMRRVEMLRESVKTEETIALERHAKELSDLTLAQENSLITQQDAMLMEQDLLFKHMDELARIRGNGEKAITDITRMNWSERASFMIGKMAEMTAGIASSSKAAFNINKAAAIGQAIMDTQAGAARALKDFPAPWSYAVAGATYAQGIARVSAIKSQQFGGSGGAGGAGGSTSLPSAPSNSAAAGGQAMNQTISVQGISSSDLFSGDAVRTLIDRLIDAQRNGARIVLA